jgi:hypothetical protein
VIQEPIRPWAESFNPIGFEKQDGATHYIPRQSNGFLTIHPARRLECEESRLIVKNR